MIERKNAMNQFNLQQQQKLASIEIKYKRNGKWIS